MQAGNLTSDGYSLAASSFADAAATYAASLVKASPQLPLATPDKESPAPGLYVASPGRWTSFNSCSSESSFGSAESAADNCFLPLEEEEEEEASPVPDQAWWEEFGEFESAPQVQLQPNSSKSVASL